MTIAASLQNHLSRKHIAYGVVAHPPAMASIMAAEGGGVPVDRVAKAVVVRAGET